jgi:TPR repeat protein
MKRFLLLIFFLSQSVLADLDQAIAYAEAGDVRKGQIELYNISQRALEGQPKSMCEFGTMYKKEGYWIVQSDKDASDWWLKSAEMGYAPCQFNIGAAYLIGSGIEKDLSKAKYWLQQAIDSTNEKFSESAKVIYAIHELDKY